MCDAAELLAEGPIMKLAWNKVEQAVRDLQEASEPLPVGMQKLLYKRRASFLLDGVKTQLDKANMDDFLTTVLPWDARQEEGEVHSPMQFDGINPQLAHLPFDKDEKIAQFAEVMYDFIARLLAYDESSCARVVEV